MGESGGGGGEGGSSSRCSSITNNWIVLDGRSWSLGEEDKYEMMHRLNIDARDLRILDPLLSYPSTIFSRHNAILLNLEHIKAIITVREVLVQDPRDENVVPVVEEMQRRLPMMPTSHLQHISSDDDDTEAAADDEHTAEWSRPFEFRALEIVLEAVCSFLAARTTELEMATYPALDQLTSKTSSRNLERVRKLKSAMTRLTARVQKVRDELEQLMDDDDDMADLYLSRKLAAAASRSSSSIIAGFAYDHDHHDVEELEMLLEAYFMQIDDTLNKLTTIDNYRNQLIKLELFLKTGEMSISFYSLVAAIFGTNFPYVWRDNHGYLFKWVVIFSGIATALMFLGTIAYARKKGAV